jgi:hypothetical protein
MKQKKRESAAKKASSQTPIEEQTRNQTGQQQANVDIDEVNLKTSYANGFRTSATAEEVVVDFGLNYIQPPDQQTGEQKMAFKANERIIMNYFSAKRLTLALSQIVRRYEQEFGDLELDAAKRQIRSNKK